MNLVQTMTETRKGKFLTEAQEAFQELAKVVNSTGKKGRIKLVLELEPQEDGVLSVNDDVEVKIPKPNKSSTLFYVDEVGSLHREDPRQPEFPTMHQEAAKNLELERAADAARRDVEDRLKESL